MRRVLAWITLALVVVAAGAGLYLYRQITHLTHERVTPDVHVVFGLGGNVGVLRTGEGTVIVDTMTFPLQGERIRALAEELTGEPVVAIVNTHYHSDHTHGNPGFDEHVRIVATERTRRHLLERDREFWEDREGYVPGETFDDEHVLRFGRKTVRLVHPDRGHTDGDLVALFVEDGVVHMGDLLFAGRYPNVDLEAGGSIARWPAALDAVTALPFERVIPGHGPVTDRAGIARFRAFLVELWAAGEAARASGWTLDETLARTRLTKDREAGLEPFVIPLIVRLDRDFVVRRAWEEATGAVTAGQDGGREARGLPGVRDR
jgi:glyoxylase-like metal-dependent hydrolase (beta-lactamase superfamily II)